MERAEERKRRLISEIAERMVTEEGLELSAYKCTAGKWTIGVGRNFQDKPFSKAEQELIARTSPVRPVKFDKWGHPEALSKYQTVELTQTYHAKGATKKFLPAERISFHISREAADLCLKNDVEEAWNDAERIFAPLLDQPDNVIKAVVDLIFNMGFSKFFGFKKTIAAIKQKKYGVASYELKDSAYARQLPKRSARNCFLLQTADPGYKGAAPTTGNKELKTRTGKAAYPEKR